MTEVRNIWVVANLLPLEPGRTLDQIKYLSLSLRNRRSPYSLIIEGNKRRCSEGELLSKGIVLRAASQDALYGQGAHKQRGVG